MLASILMIDVVPAGFDLRVCTERRSAERNRRELKAVDDLEPAFADAKRANAQAAVFMADNVMFGNRKQVAELALRQRLPTIHSFTPEVRDGGLMFYGLSNGDSYQRCAALADRILRGARPGELPVEQPARYELIVNLLISAIRRLDLDHKKLNLLAASVQGKDQS